MSLRRLICHTSPKNCEHEVVICVIFEQVRIHNRISREHWAGALMEVRSLFVQIPQLKKMQDGPRTDRLIDQQTDRP